LLSISEFSVNEEALQFLRKKKKQQRPLFIISVVGLKRQGKSHILNRLVEKIGGIPGKFKALEGKNS